MLICSIFSNCHPALFFFWPETCQLWINVSHLSNIWLLHLTLVTFCTFTCLYKPESQISDEDDYIPSHHHHHYCHHSAAEMMSAFFSRHVHHRNVSSNEIERDNLLLRPFCRHVWRWVVVPPDFFIAKLAK